MSRFSSSLARIIVSKFSTINSSLRVSQNFLCSLANSLEESKVETFGTTWSVDAKSKYFKAKTSQIIGSIGVNLENYDAETSWIVGELDVLEVEAFGTLNGCGKTPQMVPGGHTQAP